MKATSELGICCVTGCSQPATIQAAPNVCYCDGHQARNIQSTRAMMSREFGVKKLPYVRKDGKFVRFPKFKEWELPPGTVLADGVIYQP